MSFWEKALKVYNTFKFYLLVDSNNSGLWLQKNICDLILLKTFRLADGKTPLHFSVLRDQENLVKFLVSNKVNLDAQDNLGNTALHYAAGLGYLNLVHLLLMAGARDDILNNKKLNYMQLLWKYRAKNMIKTNNDLDEVVVEMENINTKLKRQDHLVKRLSLAIKDIINM